MFKRLPLVTVLLAGVSIVFAVLITKELTRAPRRSPARSQPAASVATPPPAQPAAPAPNTGPGAYAVVASRNLFSPTRSEAPVTPPTPPTPAATLPKPNLYGVVLQEGVPAAYLEDPVTKRVARYRVGDSVAGGKVEAIEADTVKLARPEGQVIVRLHDPSRPKPAAAMPVPMPSPSAGGPVPTPTPGLAPGLTPGVTPPTGGSPVGMSPRRGLPPGALGRVPPQPADVPTPR